MAYTTPCLLKGAPHQKLLGDPLLRVRGLSLGKVLIVKCL